MGELMMLLDLMITDSLAGLVSLLLSFVLSFMLSTSDRK